MKIAIVGSPGSGKTTLAYGLFYFMKKMGYNVEHVQELIKNKVYQKKDFLIEGFDVHNNIEQRTFEKIFDEANPPFDFIICDAPTFNGYFYASFYKKEEADILKTIAKKTVNNYDVVLKIDLKMDKDSYQQQGRLESFEKSKKLRDHIFSQFDTLGFKKEIIVVDERDDILKIIKQLEEIRANKK